MQKSVWRNIQQASLRANPDYELVLFDHLPSEQQEALATLREQPDLYGVLQPKRNASGNLKSVCRDTALLLFTLRQPGRLPGYVREMFGEDADQAVAELVLDGVLEIEHDGAFVSGAAAYNLVHQGHPAANGESATARLSMEALQYAQALPIADAPTLSTRLYYFNRVPLSPRWRRQFQGAGEVARYLGFDERGANRPVLKRYWSALPQDANGGWSVWQSLRQRRASSSGGVTYKLYVSPRCEDLPEVFRATVEILSASPALSFKVGGDIYGLLRPDKLVAYFDDLEALGEVAERLARRLGDVAVQGVPFTAAVTPDGLLSWGVDPPRSETLPLTGSRESWRLWLTNRLAVALLAAKQSPPETVEPWQFAVERLRLEGIDTTTWTPATIWRQNS